MNLRIKKWDSYTILVGVLYILSQNILWLSPNTAIRDVVPLLIIVIDILVLLKNSFRMVEKKLFALFMCVPVLAFISSLQEHFIYGSSIFAAFINQRQWWAMSLLCIPLSYYADKQKMKCSNAIQMIVAIGFLQVLIGITQMLLGANNLFTYAPLSERYGHVRYYFPIVMMVLALFIKFDQVLNTRKKVFPFVFVIFVLVEIVFVQNFRMTMLGVLLSMGLVFCIWRKAPFKKILIFIIIGLSAIIVVMNNKTLYETVTSMFLRSSSGQSSLAIRYNLHASYIQDLKNHPILGMGWVDSPYALSHLTSFRYVYSSTGESMYSFADGGILSFYYAYGLPGMIWFVSMWAYMIREGWKVAKKYNCYYFFSFPVYMIFTCWLDIHWYINMQFMVIVVFNYLRVIYVKERMNYRELGTC